MLLPPAAPIKRKNKSKKESQLTQIRESMGSTYPWNSTFLEENTRSYSYKKPE